jgi:branched-chain amino acid transport system substrate-binding protein
MKIKALSIAALAALSIATPAIAQDTIKLISTTELSGAGAVSGTNFKQGAELAVEHINAKGGILGKKIEFVAYDTKTTPADSRAAIQRALDEGTYALIGPVFSGPILATMEVAAEAGVTQIVGGEAAAITKKGNKSIFRTSLSQADAMPKIAKYLKDDVKATKVAIIFVNNDFGKGGRDAIKTELEKVGIQVVADVSTEQGQADFAADALKVKNSGADAVFSYVNEEESARFLRAAKQQGITVPLVGETTLLGQKVIELAGEAANGAKGHVGLSIDAPVPAFQTFAKAYAEKFKTNSDHNGIKGYTAVYMVKAATEKMGKIDRKGLADALHGMTISPDKEPGILIESTFDANGDVDRASFMGEVINGKQVINKTLPKLRP